MKHKSNNSLWNNSPWVKRLAVGLCACALLACTPKPWIKPYERHHLADPIMNKGRNPVSAAYSTHVFQAREGSRGSESTQGVGCGCN